MKEIESQYISEVYNKLVIRQFARTDSPFHLWPRPIGNHECTKKSRAKMRKSPQYDNRYSFQNKTNAAIEMSQYFADHKKEILFLVINFAGFGTTTHAYVGKITIRREGN